VTIGAAERVGPDSDVGILAEHRCRYRFAAKMTAPKRLLDIACGSGLGFSYFPEAALVVGVDVDVDALRLSNDARSGSSSATALARADATALPFLSGSFDVINSFETVEHISDVQAFLMELARLLSPEGTLVISTPNAIVTCPSFGVPRNPFHIREYTPAQFRELLLVRFGDVEILGQRVAHSFGPCPRWEQGPGSPWTTRLLGAFWKLQLRVRLPALVSLASLLRGHRDLFPGEDDFIFVGSGIERCHDVIAICRQPHRDPA
jgi:SAM-dependent methyltransferase